LKSNASQNYNVQPKLRYDVKKNLNISSRRLLILDQSYITTTSFNQLFFIKVNKLEAVRDLNFRVICPKSRLLELWMSLLINYFSSKKKKTWGGHSFECQGHMPICLFKEDREFRMITNIIIIRRRTQRTKEVVVVWLTWIFTTNAIPETLSISIYSSTTMIIIIGTAVVPL
jgi:hypothetical protein